MKTKTKKKYSTVAALRKIREKLSKEIMNMSFEEEKVYLKKLLNQNPSIAAEPRVKYGKK